MFFIILCFILSLKVVFIHAERHTWRQNRWAIAPILQGKLNMFNLPCKTVQDYPARLHASYCASLQRVGYLARCCTQYIARYLARNIASCRQALSVHLLVQSTSVSAPMLVPGTFCHQGLEHQSQCRGRLSY